jgi:FixJ family two-component response regulator
MAAAIRRYSRNPLVARRQRAFDDLQLPMETIRIIARPHRVPHARNSSDGKPARIVDTDRGTLDNESVVYVVDDDLQVRTDLKGLIESIGLCCELFNSPAEFALAQRTEKVSCLILDVPSPELGAFPLQAELARERPHMLIIMMSANADIRMAVKAIKRGAVDFFAKPYRDQDLLEAIQWALVRAHRSRQRETTMRDLLKKYYSLSPREMQVMLLVCDGLRSKQIARKLGVAEVTVKVHRQNMMKKLSVDSIPALVRMADAIEAERGGPFW